MPRARVVVGALEVARLGRRPVHQASVGKVTAGLRGDGVKVREPGVDHPRLCREREVVDRELLEAPSRALVGAAADLKDQRLTALTRERREIVVQIRQKLEVDEHLDRRALPPYLR